MKQLLVLLFLLCTTSVFAQDVIVKKDGSNIVCWVVELTSTEIIYKRWGELNGSKYVMNRSDASAINYQNGKKVNLSGATNLYQPNNQNNGVRQYNDMALLRMDASARAPLKKARNLRLIGWAGGIVLAGLGVGIPLIQDESDDLLTGIGIGLGVAWTTTFLLIANNYKKKADLLQTSSIYQYNINVNGKILSPSIDLLRDQALNKQTIGIGLRYNF